MLHYTHGFLIYGWIMGQEKTQERCLSLSLSLKIVHCIFMQKYYIAPGLLQRINDNEQQEVSVSRSGKQDPLLINTF